MKIRIAALLLLCVGIAACSSSGGSGGSGDSEDQVPHARGRVWIVEGASFHGAQSRSGSLDCSECHERSSYCLKCHFDPSQEDVHVPAGETWPHGLASHAGSVAGLAAWKEKCSACHGVVKGYTGQPSRTGSDCDGCHGSSMHSMPYADGHGAAALADLLSCRRCHDTPAALPNFDGYVSGAGCAASCHTEAKAHPFPWYEGHRSVGSNWPTACAICHNTGSATPAVGPFPRAPSCFSASFNSRSCHAGGPTSAPHASGRAWLDPSQPTFHGVNLGLLPCQDCHDQSTFCSTCHFGSTGAKVPPGVAWTHGRYPHALNPALTSQQAVCNQCHSLLKGFNSQPSRVDCANCHGLAGHGSYMLAHTTTAGMDLVQCQVCHGQPGSLLFEGGVAQQKTPCSTCHARAKAHPVPWRFSAGSGVSHMSAGNVPAACAICHDTVIEGTGTTPMAGAPACRACHSTGFVSHSGEFTEAGAHGPVARANLSSCQPCHSDDPTGGPGSNPRFNVRISAGPGAGLVNGCEDCHVAGGAHATNWQGEDGNKLSHRTAGGLPGACNICHGADLAGSTADGVARPSCFASSFTNAEGATTACHVGGYPNKQQFHPDLATWVADHQPIARVAASAATCYECHEPDGTTYLNNIWGFNNVPGCGVCHFGASGSRVPAGVDWVHGSVPHGSLQPYAAVCDACHGVTSAPDVNCTGSCHFATHPFGQDWMSKASPTFHGIEAAPDPSPCAVCHGDDYLGGWAGPQTSCYRCHFNESGYKLPTASEHGVPFPSGSHQLFTDSASVCNACHQTNVAYGNASPAFACTTACHVHDMGQPWMDKSTPTFHGIAARADLTYCRACHGADYRGGSAGPQTSCYRCHFSPLGRMSPDSAAHVGFYQHESDALARSYYAVCNACHETNVTYGNPSPTQTCYPTCHF